jgi:hypothetical protein
LVTVKLKVEPAQMGGVLATIMGATGATLTVTVAVSLKVQLPKVT